MLKFLLKIPIYLLCFRTGRRWLCVSTLLLLSLVLFCHFGPQRFKLSPIQERIGGDLVRQAVEKFPWDREVGSVMMITDREAWDPYFTKAIRDRVTYYSSNGGRKFDILPDNFVKRVMKTLGFRTVHSSLTDKQIKRICGKMAADTLLLVRFSGADYVEDEEGATGRLECTFFPKGGSEPIRVEVHSVYEKKSHVVDPVSHLFVRMNTVERIVWVVLGIVLFPFLMSPITVWVLRRQSARANALMIFAYSVVVFTVSGLVLPSPEDALGGVLWCVCGIAVVWYLLKVCDLIASPGFKRRMQSY